MSNNVPKLRFKGFTDEWKEQKLGDLCTTITKGTTPKKFEDLGVYFIKIECFNKGKIDKKKCLFISEEIHNKELRRSILKEKDILFAIAGATIGKCAIVDKEDLPANTNQALSILRLKDNVNNKFILNILNSNVMKEYINLNISVGAQPNLNLEQMNNFKFKISSIEEQEKIANFLTKIDNIIEKQEEKLINLENYKKGMMQKIFSQEIRFKNENGEEYPNWKEKEFGEFLNSRVQKQIPSPEVPLMAFTATGGIEHKGDRYDRSFLVKSDEKLYKRTELNDFIYSSNNLDVGSIGLNKYGTAVISDVYEIFIVSKDVSPNFISELIKTPKVINKIIRYRQGVMYGQYRIHADDFLKIREFIPCLEEQQKINKLLFNIDKVVEKEKEKLEKLRLWKKGLLQQMFV